MHDLDLLAQTSTKAVGGAPPLSQLVERSCTRQRRRAVRRGVGIAAAMVLVVFGALMVTRPFSTPVDTADGRIDESGNLITAFDPLTAVPDPWDVVVFFKADATDQQIAAVQRLLDQSTAVDASAFVSKEDTYAEFLEFFAGDEELLSTVTVETMPPSIKVSVEDIEDPLFAFIDESDGVRTIIASTGEIPKPISVYGDPIFDIRASRLLFFASRAGEDEAFRRCMQRKGFESQEPLSTLRWLPEDYLRALNVGDDLAYANEWGFGLIPVHTTPIPRPAENNGGADGISEDDPYYKAAFGGLFSGGCEAEASDTWVIGSRSGNLDSDAIREAQASFAEDPRVFSHYAEWSECMAGAGYNFTSPLSAERSFVREIEVQEGEFTAAEAEEATARERAAAITTVECGESSVNLVSAALANVWADHGERGWDSNKFHVSSEQCLGEDALQVNLADLFDPSRFAEVFPDSCFE